MMENPAGVLPFAPSRIVPLILVVALSISLALAPKPSQSDELNSTKPAPAKLEKATETLVSTSEALAETPLKIVQQATINAWKGLVSGQGRGTCTYKSKDKPDTEFDFEIAFDGDKFNFVMTEGSAGVNAGPARTNPLFQ